MKRIVYSGLIIAGIIISAIFSSNIFSQLNQHHIEMQMATDEAKAYRLKEHIVERFLKAQLDSVFVASYLADYLENRSLNSSDEIAGIKSEIHNVIPSLINVNSIFSGASYLDSNGTEVVYMDNNGFEAKPQLGAAARDNCFHKTSLIKNGEIYTTFDEKSIFICTPVCSDSGVLSGVIVMVVNEDELLNELQPLLDEGNIILMEDTGKYILAADKYNNKENFLDEYPESLLSEILSSQSGNLVYDKNTIITYMPVDLDDRQWFLILSTDKEKTTAMFSALYEKLIIVILLATLAIITALIFWFRSNKKNLIAKQEKEQNIQLESVNTQLQKKQYVLEEQNAIIEELNSQLEEENIRYFQQKEQLEETNNVLFERQYTLELQNTVIEELNSKLNKENVRYQQQKEILQAILDSLGAGIVMLDPLGKITFINKAWKDLFDYLDSNAVCQACENFYINDNNCGNSEQFLQNLMTGMEKEEETAATLIGLIGDNESRYSVDLEQLSPVKRFLNLYSNPCISNANSNFGRVFVIRDISHQKEVDNLKLELISTVSHELRTPMSSILGFSELLLTRKLTEERNKEYISIINAEARRLTELINDFLDIQRMESGKHMFNKQYNSISQMIEETMKLFENNGNTHYFTYDKGTERTQLLYCDRNKVLQVLSNLISNAIKYSPNGGEIKIDLTVESGRAKVSVTDHGLGIPEDEKDKLFTKFFRVDNDDRRKIGGTGLGLAICKEIIRAHGGEIGVETIYGKGSTFYFYLPYSGSSNKTELEEVVTITSSESNGNLLIVEDDVSMVKLIKEILKDEGLEMHDVNSGEEAIKIVERNLYKLIILDIALSGQMSGWDVLKELKNNQLTVNTPIIISSVNENKNFVSQNDITDYLVKPFEPEQLIKMVRKASNGKLNSKMVLKSDDRLAEVILEMLSSRKIGVRQIEHSGNILIITLDGKEGLVNE